MSHLQQVLGYSPYELARLLGIPISRWPYQYQRIASGLLCRGFVDGALVKGFYMGEVNPRSIFYGRRIISHAWIELGEDMIMDPVRWVFEDEPPYVFVGRPGLDYDANAETYRYFAVSDREAPDYNERHPQIVLEMPSYAWVHVHKVLDYTVCLKKEKVLTLAQLFYLANLPIEMLEPYAVEIYQAIEGAGQRSLIPISNYDRARVRAA